MKKTWKKHKNMKYMKKHEKTWKTMKNVGKTWTMYAPLEVNIYVSQHKQNQNNANTLKIVKRKYDKTIQNMKTIWKIWKIWKNMKKYEKNVIIQGKNKKKHEKCIKSQKNMENTVKNANVQLCMRITSKLLKCLHRWFFCNRLVVPVVVL